MTTSKSSLATMLSSALHEAAWQKGNTQFNHAMNASVFVDMLTDYMAEQIAVAITPAAMAKAQRDAMGIKRIIGVGGIPAIDHIGYEPAPDATPVEDEYRVLLDVIRELVSSQGDLVDGLANAIEYMPEFKQIVVNRISKAQAINGRANAILAEHNALDVAPERDDED